jgi:predicted metal-dependent phosphoesterase TrpH
MKYPEKMDLHMHSTVSDGTDTPEQILESVKKAGIDLFALTDHDAIKGCISIEKIRKSEDPKFLTGVEFSCKDESGKYHILGYGYDPDAQAIRNVVDLGHSYRITKVKARLKLLKEQFGITFSQEDVDALFALDNPGKPHIGNLMTEYKYVRTKEEAIKKYINQVHFRSQYVRPEQAITGILGAGGIPVLAHPSFGSGDQLIIGRDMDERLQRLVSFGLQGVEAYYSGFTRELQEQMLQYAWQYDLYVTAGSDYHGTNKPIGLGNHNCPKREEYPAGMIRFLDAIHGKIK